MDMLLKLDMNIISGLLLLYVCVIAFFRLDRSVKSNRYFLIISALTVLQVALDIGTSLIEPVYSPALYFPDLLLLLLMNGIAPFITYFWSVFIFRWVHQEDEGWRSSKVLLLPGAVALLMTLSSPFTGIVFSVDQQSFYRRGPFFGLFFSIVCLNLLYGVFILVRSRKKFTSHEFLPLLSFAMVPAAAGIIQALFYGLLILWGSVALSLVVVYIFLQQKMMQLDMMTGAWTKSSFENYISYRAEHLGRKIGILFVDMNGFKKINDAYGHLEGDSALQTAARLLKNTVGSTGIVARFGGDEFVILIENTAETKLKRLNGRLHAAFIEYNRTSGKPYALAFSSGYGMYDKAIDIWQFINHVDHLMYINKQSAMS